MHEKGNFNTGNCGINQKKNKKWNHETIYRNNMSLNFLSILTPKTEKILLLHITSSGNNSELEVKGYCIAFACLF